MGIKKVDRNRLIAKSPNCLIDLTVLRFNNSFIFATLDIGDPTSLQADLRGEGVIFMSEESDYQSLLSELIKKQMVMLGPVVALAKARKITSLTVDDSGNVGTISGNPSQALKELAGEYMALSGQIAKTTLDLLLEKYPQIKGNSK
jgi:hypothetical protein